MPLEKRSMYRFPWSGNDNPIGWLEVTDRCNTYCRGCYRINGMQGHKPLEQVKEEIQLLKKWRNCDNISIAGGEPLIHPEILDIVAYIRELGMKPLILTNGIRLENNRALMIELKRAGAIGFTFHIDSEQARPHWKGKSEEELFELRQHFADMAHSVGGLFASFGMTVYPGNLDFVPRMVAWANKNIDRVHGLVFIGFRNAALEGDFDYYVAGKKITLQTSYAAENTSESYLTSADIYEKIKESFPHYETSAYMGGTQVHDKFTWLVSAQLGTRHKMYGSAGAKVMELFQMVHHLRHGTYVIYSPSHRLPKAAFLLGLLDSGVREAARNFLREVLRHPTELFKPLYVQSIGIIQGPDLLEDGRVDMCESCPDMTVWNGRLVHSCRLDEWRLYGGYVSPQPRHAENTPVAETAISEVTLHPEYRR
ncbi:MAG: radical SAM protein [Chloroflexota bacterium]|nr:MAG: radical SAM protein [Chloroflexota bacterium]